MPHLAWAETKTNGLVLPDGKVSRQHAELLLRNGMAVLRDRGSSNGTIVNGERIQSRAQRVLRDGDVLGIGPYRLVFQVAASPPPAPATTTRSVPPPQTSHLMSVRHGFGISVGTSQDSAGGDRDRNSPGTPRGRPDVASVATRHLNSHPWHRCPTRLSSPPATVVGPTRWWLT